MRIANRLYLTILILRMAAACSNSEPTGERGTTDGSVGLREDAGIQADASRIESRDTGTDASGSDARPTDAAIVPCPSTKQVLTATGPNNEVYRPNGAGLGGWQPGDVVEIPAGHYSLIDLGNFGGTAACPITLRNAGGLVTVDLVRFQKDAHHIRFLGDGDAALKYGIKISSAGGVGLAVTATDFEVAGVEITGNDVGIMIKRNPVAGQPDTQYPSVQSNISIHDNSVHDVHGEGMYIGHTYPNADPYNGNLVPSRLANVKIFNNVVARTDWDGIQLSNATDAAEIHHNTVTNFGLINLGSQQAGIILGGNTNGSVHDNHVENGTGNGIECFGYGLNMITNNVVMEAGMDGTANGQETIYVNDPVNLIESRPKQQMVVSNNVIRNSKPSPTRRGAIRVAAYANNSLPATMKGNMFALPGATAGWESLYLLGPGGSTITGNALIP